MRTLTVAIARLALPAALAGSARSDGCVPSECGTTSGALSGGNARQVTVRDAATDAPVTR